MPNIGLMTKAETLVALATVTTTGTSSALTLPQAQSHRVVVEVQTVSGTSPTLQVIMATSDDSTQYHEIMSLTQITTSGLGRQAIFRTYLGVGDAATEGVAALLGTADIASSADVKHGPVNPRYIKFRWVLTGTSPSFAFAIKVYSSNLGGGLGL